MQKAGLIGGKYKLLRRLGEGAAAVVWEAENVVVGRTVALKLLRPGVAESPGAKEQFLAEARAAARLADSHVVDVFDFGQADDGTPFIVMELLRGETLEHVVRARGRLTYRLSCDIIAQVLAALVVAHDHGFVHRDLKPGNINVRFSSGGRPIVKVLDFGIATLLHDGHALDDSGLLFGTPEYMAPEQATGGQLDGRTDLYAAGIVLYEMLSGSPPFTGAFPEAVLAQVLTAEPVSITHLVPELPADLGRVVMSALSRDPARRPRNARDFVADISPFCDRELIASIDPPPPTHSGGTLASMPPILLTRPRRPRASKVPPAAAPAAKPARPRVVLVAESSLPPGPESGRPPSSARPASARPPPPARTPPSVRPQRNTIPVGSPSAPSSSRKPSRAPSESSSKKGS